jgi:hypothetical protein
MKGKKTFLSVPLPNLGGLAKVKEKGAAQQPPFKLINLERL